MRNQYKLLAEKYKLVKENEDEDFLAGVNKVADLVDPKGKVVYGEMEIDYGGEFASLDAYIDNPKELPPNCFWICPGVYMPRGQKPNYRGTYIKIYIVDKELALDLQSTIKDEVEPWSPRVGQFMTDLYSALSIDGENEPQLPQ
jgi:hypothetical protein